ncbi:hypothetical protein [Qaidamihabitans albus]|uniref:hypothetical protein n=1 Tax=Qaidamihabitans albus TaxID=2795733 RepID=UPI0027DE357E|nr:hypothetical protein [Qaidamihabitans albus]
MRAVLSGVFAVALFVLAGCGESPDPSQPPPPAGPPATTTTKAPTPEPGEQVTLEGVVQRGVEPNCLVLMAEERQYLLLGADEQVEPGDEVVVQGRAVPDQPTTCMQGIPVEVTDTRPA